MRLIATYQRVPGSLVKRFRIEQTLPLRQEANLEVEIEDLHVEVI